MLCENQKAKQSCHCQTMTNSQTPAQTLIHEHRIWVQFQGERNGLCFARIKPCIGHAQRDGLRRNNLDPIWKAGMNTMKLTFHGRRYHHTFEKLPQ